MRQIALFSLLSSLALSMPALADVADDKAKGAKGADAKADAKADPKADPKADKKADPKADEKKPEKKPEKKKRPPNAPLDDSTPQAALDSLEDMVADYERELLETKEQIRQITDRKYKERRQKIED